jgi:ATP-dependent protease Clp ATPase subunit
MNAINDDIRQSRIKAGKKLLKRLSTKQKEHLCTRLHITTETLQERLNQGDFCAETYILATIALQQTDYSKVLKLRLPWVQNNVLTWDQDKFGARRSHDKLIGIFARDEFSHQDQLRIERALKSTLSIPVDAKMQLIRAASQISTEALIRFAEVVEEELHAIERRVLLIRSRSDLFENDDLEDRIEKCVREWARIEESFIDSKNYVQTTDTQGDLYPFAIVEKLSRSVIGQQEALKKVATTLYYHKKIHHALTQQSPLPFSPLRPLLIAGQTGSGKTFMIRKACELIGIPFIHVDVSSMVSTGIRGNSFDEVAKNIIRTSDYDLNAAQASVVVFDEVDKVLDTYYGESVMSQMLRFVEGTNYPIEKHMQENDEFKNIKFLDTSNMLFIFAGSFQALVDAQKQHRQSGFIKETAVLNEQEQYRKRIEKSGLKKELLGRIDEIIILEPLTEREYGQILLESDDSPIKEYRRRLEMVGAEDYIPTEDEIDSIVKQASHSPYGARTLHKLVRELYAQKMYDIHQQARDYVSDFAELERRLRAYIGLKVEGGSDGNDD